MGLLMLVLVLPSTLLPAGWQRFGGLTREVGVIIVNVMHVASLLHVPGKGSNKGKMCLSSTLVRMRGIREKDEQARVTPFLSIYCFSVWQCEG